MEKERLNYGETFCDAIDIIVSEKLKALKFDVTKVCTIVSNIYKDLGRYTVQEENIKYEAYSTNKDYAVDDVVLVTIPNGDYSMQKMIVSKAAYDNDLMSSVGYVSPLEQMLDFTGNIIPEAKEFSLLANDVGEDGITGTMEKIYSIPWSGGTSDGYSDYTRMGISVDFQTWLRDLDVTSGSYGLMFYFYDSISSTEDMQNRNAAYVLTLNADDILGNPYDFESYVTQQKLFDISYLQNVTQLDIYFYQNKDFRNTSNELVSRYVEVTEADKEFLDIEDSQIPEEQRISDNLFVNNLKIYLGYSLNEFSGDELRLSTNDTLDYSAAIDDNRKSLILKWIHKIDDTHYELLNKDSENIEIYWVRYGTTYQPIEHIVGSKWTTDKMDVNQLNPFLCTLNIDDTLRMEREIDIKAVGRVRQPDGNWLIINSNQLSFKSKDPKVDETTYSAAVSLQIKCEDQSEGNYFLYNQNSKLINEGLGQGYLRSLKLYYKGWKIEESDELKNNISQIQWIIPTNTDELPGYTMLQWEPISTQNIELQGNEKTINFSGDNLDVQQDSILEYSISNTWYAENSHNTIQCKVSTKSGNIYTAEKELIFGKANSQGSNISLILQYANNKNAYEVMVNGNSASGAAMTIQGLIYDLSGKLIDSSKGVWTWEMIGNDFTCTGNDDKTDTATLSLKDTISIDYNELLLNKYNIIKAMYTPVSGNPITAYLPVAIRYIYPDSDEQCATMEGARDIVYNSTGIPQYYTGAYILRKSNREAISGITWEAVTGNNYPTLADTNGEIALKANPIFVKDYDYRFVVIASKSNKVLWIQPVLIMQSMYDFTIFNDWNGTTLLEGDNSIVAAMIAAGKKSSENKFSGILLGDISSQGVNGSLTQTGLYGILDGVVTFVLSDSGNASFEYSKNNSRKVLTESKIHYGEDNLFISNTADSKYFLLDIDDQILELRNNTVDEEGSILTLAANAPYLKLENKYGTILSFGKTTNYLQTASFSDSTGININLENKSITGRADSVLTWQGTASIGKLTVDSNGEIFYNGKTLADYIKEIAEK